jgi:putative salt-induced outer membrane protein YdiY
MKKSITTIVAAAGFMAAFAETSTNTSPAKATAETKYPWKSGVSAGLTLTRGNKSTTLFTADFTTQRKTPTDEYLLGLGGAYGQQDSRDTVNNYKVFAQWNHLFTEKFFGYVRTEGLQDRIKDLDYRLTIGPGAGYYLIKGTNTTLAVEAGAGFEAQKLGGKDESFATVRLADRFEHKLNDRARLWESAELLPQVDKFDNFVVNFEIGIETAISKSFSLKTYLADTYANRPAAGRRQNDVKLVAGVSYKF